MAEMFVVIEWNQASHQPELATKFVYDSAEEAESAAVMFRADTARYGRRERYTVHAIDDEPVGAEE